MKILYLLADGPERLCSQIVEAQSGEHEVTVLDLARREAPYEKVVEEIFAHDRVISW